MELVILLGLALFAASSLRTSPAETATAPPPPPTGNPRDIVIVKGYKGKEVKLYRITAQAFLRLQAAAKQAGFNLLLTSGFRTYAEQKSLWEDALKKYKTEELARKHVAKPGGSQHEIGSAIDLWLGYDGKPENADKIRGTAVYTWLTQNANRYGWRWYDRTIEPWHLEYYYFDKRIA